MGEVFSKLRPLLDERQRRALAGLTARALGRGGVAQVAAVSGMSRKTVSNAVAEVDVGLDPSPRVRRRGGGRKRLIDIDPALLVALDDLVEPDSRGDPMCRLRWTCKSTRRLADELTDGGHRVSWTVAQALHYMDYSLQANAKTGEGAQHPDHDAVPLPQRSGDGPFASGLAGHLLRYQKEGDHRQPEKRRPGVATEGTAGRGGRA